MYVVFNNTWNFINIVFGPDLIFFEVSSIMNSPSDVLEPIQSRCAVLRYSKLDDSQLLHRLLQITEQEDVSYTDDGMEAIIFTAQGDMRQVKENRVIGKGGGADDVMEDIIFTAQGDMRQVKENRVIGKGEGADDGMEDIIFTARGDMGQVNEGRTG